MDGMTRRDLGKVIGATGLGAALPRMSYSDEIPDPVSARREFDVARARRETPGCANVIHLNNAGSALTPQPVIDALHGHLRLEEEIGGYEAADAASTQRSGTYRAIAKLLNCHPDEIAVVENATRAWDMAFYGLALGFKQGDRILTSRAAYCSNYIAYLQAVRRTGAVIEVLPDDDHGQVDVDALAQTLAKGQVAMVGITHVPTNGGLVNPAAAIGQLTREAEVPYLLDACQSAGQWPLDVETIGCDMLSATGRKFLRGPRGTGFLYVRKDLIGQLEPPLLDVRAASWTAQDRYEIQPTARRFENWESYVAGGIALGVAVEYAMGWGIEAIRDRVVALADRLRAALSAIPGVTVRDLGQERCGIVTFTVEGKNPGSLRSALKERKMNVTTSSVGSTRLDMEARGLSGLVRSSVHYYNTESELDQFVAVVTELAG